MINKRSTSCEFVIEIHRNRSYLWPLTFAWSDLRHRHVLCAVLWLVSVLNIFCFALDILEDACDLCCRVILLSRWSAACWVNPQRNGFKIHCGFKIYRELIKITFLYQYWFQTLEWFKKNQKTPKTMYNVVTTLKLRSILLYLNI